MPSPFDTLSTAQKDAFNSRVQQLGFDPKAIAGSHIVTKGAALEIHGSVPEFANHVKYKTFSSISEVKRMLGVPDAAFKAGTSDGHIKYPEPPAYASKADVTLAGLSEEERNDLEAATYAHLFGDSSKVDGWTDTINRLMLPRELSFVAAESVTVTPSSPLIITNPSYTFGTVTIEPGGQIIVKSDSAVNVQVLIKK